MRNLLLEGKVGEQNKKCLAIDGDTLGQSNENHVLIPGAVAGIPMSYQHIDPCNLNDRERVANLADPIL